MIEYKAAYDIREQAISIVSKLGFDHIDPERLYFFRSFGSKSRYTRARIHGLAKVWNEALHFGPRYLIEVIAESFDNLTSHEKEKIIIHELLHIPRGFTGGFVNHGYAISKTRIENLHRAFCTK